MLELGKVRSAVYSMQDWDTLVGTFPHLLNLIFEHARILICDIVLRGAV